MFWYRGRFGAPYRRPPAHRGVPRRRSAAEWVMLIVIAGITTLIVISALAVHVPR